ncbi:sigma-E factor negative regulatory protein [Comamonas endophytica]|uniref:Sigma-E factor negative regulatory protein n=1 Tax=Comamonas endophytica TaxID=2949090 RepID=A0ABY6GBN7_9BURK|nr:MULTISPECIES: sigma-E factor negative regulatory protein [unclassified Acidovorax]MCD2513511.1 sigma-E factor negative regulatory protein [Acidovorax sp. D4N7]UYG52475.1 sigma-E factor negative regulatory protein [Acidovorax sp. 5MLIR]
MNQDLNQSQREQLSALADGELAAGDIGTALAFADSDEGRQAWQLYQLVGDVLRSPELAHHAQHDVLSGVRAELAREPRLQPAQLRPIAAAHAPERAANASVFRWKMAAGVASFAAVAAFGWSSLRTGSDSGMQLVQNDTPQQSVPGEMLAMQAGPGAPIMLRDPRLDELLAAHRQYSSVAALQMPANFLRNASFSDASVHH